MTYFFSEIILISQVSHCCFSCFQAVILYFRLGRGLTSAFKQVVDSFEERSVNKAEEAEFWDRLREGVDVAGGMLETSLNND